MTYHLTDQSDLIFFGNRTVTRASEKRQMTNDKNPYNSLNNCLIFNPKPLLESSEPQLQPCIIFELVRAPAPLLGIIR